jgi:L-alanine-DL-glutamate epimerase-like enolase superfamily enzyme
MAGVLADAGFQALESPLPPNRLREYQALKRHGALPILMDEGIVSPVEAEEFAALGMMDGIAMKVARCGGLCPALGIVHLLRKQDLLLFASGLTDPDLSLAASAHLFAAAALQRPAALNGPQYLSGRGTTDAGFRAAGNRLRVPSDAGQPFRRATASRRGSRQVDPARRHPGVSCGMGSGGGAPQGAGLPVAAAFRDLSHLFR